ncbi:hypothetical protein [Lactobacillus crispatus]|uniref:hypothetical protein n=1 Tax=Lactobacillus crispatus TaxID=47770 RepID=UPI0022AC6CA9|nr:hypothetical protein [Lactobacillus crispatus]MCZ3571662.1 hypothetical protein [Lactobacillus crispatus]MCZ3577675.1 hypothetical protein [Lactobacillus crispatus]MCZ3597031.1 hypothetical protein [Lactobacillus crispatus]
MYVFFCSNQSYEKGTPFSNVLRNKFKELFILTQTILQSPIASLFDGDSNLSNIDLSNVNFGNNIGDNGDSFGHVGNKLSNVNLTNAKGIPEAVLRAWGQAAKNTKATELSMSTFTVSTDS